MLVRENFIVFPEGELQEIDMPLAIDALVDLNGKPLALPLPTPRMIAYRVIKIRRREERGEEASYHYLELVPSWELIAYSR